MRCSSVAIIASSLAARCVSRAAVVVFSVARATVPTVAAISSVPRAASPMLRVISAVAALCSCTDAAIADCVVLICSMMRLISEMAVTAPRLSARIALTRRAMSSVARAVSRARSFTSFATTANPLPASPARAASISAFNARMFVCSAMELMTRMTLSICSLLSPSWRMAVLASLATRTAVAATSAASCAFWATLRMPEPTCCAEAATRRTDVFVSLLARVARPICSEVSTALDWSWLLTEASSSEAFPTATELSAMRASASLRLSTARLTAAPSRPSSSSWIEWTRASRSPPAIASMTRAD